MARALVACGWYGIQTWIGGMTLLTLLGVLAGRDLSGAPLPILGIGAGQLGAYAVFWLAQLVFVEKGIDAIRRFETWTAPLKLVVCVALVWWALDLAGGLGPIVAQKSAFAPDGVKEGQFWTVFWPIFTAMSASGGRSRSTSPISPASPAPNGTRSSGRRSACRCRWRCSR